MLQMHLRAGGSVPIAKGVTAAQRRETGRYAASRRGYVHERVQWRCPGLSAWFATGVLGKVAVGLRVL